MVVGIDGSRAFLFYRTGIEEYSYQVIKYLRKELQNEKVFLYLRKGQKTDFIFPENWKIKVINFPFLWTQIGLSLEMLFRPADVLFVPGHIVPIIHPANTIATVHGLEYEFYPKAYSFWKRLYMRWSIKKSCQWAKKIIAVSENTKKDLVNLYKVPGGKIEVIYEGVNQNFGFRILNFESNYNDKILKPYLLFVGRLEERKNICGIVEAYKILKEKYKIPHELILAGAPGYGYKIIKLKIDNCKLSAKGESAFGGKIIELGYVDETTKWQLLSNADVFLFPTFYEGFGLPILEAQSVGTPVVAGDTSSIPEIVSDYYTNAGDRRDEAMPRPYDGLDGSALLVNPNNPSEIAEAAYNLISDKAFRDGIIKKGYENVKRFSWEKCAKEVAEILTK